MMYVTDVLSVLVCVLFLMESYWNILFYISELHTSCLRKYYMFRVSLHVDSVIVFFFLSLHVNCVSLFRIVSAAGSDLLLFFILVE